MSLKPLSPAEQQLVDAFNADQTTYNHAWLIGTLKTLVGTAAQVELATIPIYLYTYYSVFRLPEYKGSSTAGPATDPPTPPTPYIPDTVSSARAQEIQIYANHVGAAIMSVAVEEMLHMGLASNLLFSIGGNAQLYGNAPASYPTNLPGHNGNFRPYYDEPKSPYYNFEIPMALGLGALTYNQLDQFLMIEWPEDPTDYPEAPVDGPIQQDDVKFDTIGQIYSYIRCVIEAELVTDADFQTGLTDNQLQPGYYAPDNIDTLYPSHPYTPVQIPSNLDSAAKATAYEDATDSHHGVAELLTINSKVTALQAIGTICNQGEGISLTNLTDDPTGAEESHYYKFAAIQAQLAPVNPMPFVPLKGITPPPVLNPFTEEEVGYFVYPLPTNPTRELYASDPIAQAILDAVDGLFQYMLLLTETIYAASGSSQKGLFYLGLHNSMIWILDKLIQGMRGVEVDGILLAPTFSNIDLGQANPYGTMQALAQTAITAIGSSQSYGDIAEYLQKILVTGPSSETPPLPNINNPSTWGFPGKNS